MAPKDLPVHKAKRAILALVPVTPFPAPRVPLALRENLESPVLLAPLAPRDPLVLLVNREHRESLVRKVPRVRLARSAPKVPKGHRAKADSLAPMA